MGAAQGRLVGVGVGPGDADLVTVRGVRAIERASIVLAPTLSADEAGRAEQVVRALVPSVRLERVVMPMGRGATAAARRREAARVAAEAVASVLATGGEVVWVTLGDPGIYSTFWLVTEAVRSLVEGVEVEVVPGIVAFGALAAAAGLELLDDDEYLVLATGRTERGVIEAALENPRAAVVLYKPGELAWLASRAAELGREGVVGWLLGTPGSSVRPLAEVTGNAPYLTTVALPPLRTRVPPAGYP